MERFLSSVLDNFPPGLSAALLVAAALSFLARHRAQSLYGEIRENQAGALMTAVTLAGMGLLYALLGNGTISYTALRGSLRLLLALTAIVLIYFNWGGSSIALGDLWRAVTSRIRQREPL